MDAPLVGHRSATAPAGDASELRVVRGARCTYRTKNTREKVSFLNRERVFVI